MGDANEKARNLLEQEPGRDYRHANAADIPNLQPAKAECHAQEPVDGCLGAIAVLNARHRVIFCRDRLNLILQRRKKGGAERPWRALGYFRTKATLIRACASFNPRLDPNMMAILMALPDEIGGAA